MKKGRLLNILEYYKCVLPPLTLIVGPTANLISETYSYVKGGVCIYSTPKILNNFPSQRK